MPTVIWQPTATNRRDAKCGSPPGCLGMARSSWDYARKCEPAMVNGMDRKAATLDRLVEPLVRTLTPEVARSLIQLRADPDLQLRMDELAEKCDEGRLTA